VLIIIESRNKLTWLSKMEIDHTYEVLQVTTSKSQCKARSIVETLMKSKRNKVARIKIVQAQVKEVVFIFNLEYRLSFYQKGYHKDCQQSLDAHIA
jgi:endonuclease I